MPTKKKNRNSGPAGPGRIERLRRLGLLILPAVILAGAATRVDEEMATLLWTGAFVELAGCALAIVWGPGWRGPVDLAVIVLYLGGIGWLVACTPWPLDWYGHVAQAVLLVVPLAAFAAKILRESGAPALRQARHLAAKLARRTEWPTALADCKLLRDVAALREALHIDASPALELLKHSRPQVQLAALAALEGRRHWRPGQPEPVLQLARTAAEPEIRTAAIRALSNLADRELLESLSESLCDGSHRVRQAAAAALLGDQEVNWNWVRPAVRKALADPLCQDDGPLLAGEDGLVPEAINDLTAWASEKGLLGLRAALTLGDYYGRKLAVEPDPALLKKLRAVVEDVHAPPMLRLEHARLIHQYGVFDPPLLRNLVSPSTPAPLRLLAVENLLEAGESGQAMAALQDLARLPNREIALAVARVAQERLGIEFGLALDQPPPPVQSRLAAEVARRVLAWAAQPSEEAEAPSEVGDAIEEHNETAYGPA